MNGNEDTEMICVRKSVPNTFQTGQNKTDKDLGAIQTTVGDTTGKQPNSGSSKITLTNNKSFQCFRFPQLEVLSFFIFVLHRFTILK